MNIRPSHKLIAQQIRLENDLHEAHKDTVRPAMGLNTLMPKSTGGGEGAEWSKSATFSRGSTRTQYR
jgi:hypothetical protein